MSYGTSKHWSDILNEFADTPSYNASAIVEYFQPLTDWLIKFNTEHNVTVGWEEDKCPDPPTTTFQPEIKLHEPSEFPSFDGKSRVKKGFKFVH